MTPLSARGGGGGWADSARELVAAWLELLKAELAELTGQLRRESLLALRGVLLIVVACTLAFWGVAAVLAAAVLGLAVWWEPWLAALVVGLVVLAIAAGFGLWARARLRRVRLPTEMAAQRFGDHLRWWEREIRPATEPPSGSRPVGETRPAVASGSVEFAMDPDQER